MLGLLIGVGTDERALLDLRFGLLLGSASEIERLEIWSIYDGMADRKALMLSNGGLVRNEQLFSRLVASTDLAFASSSRELSFGSILKQGLALRGPSMKAMWTALVNSDKSGLTLATRPGYV